MRERRKWQPQEIKELEGGFRAGLTQAELARKLDRSTGSVSTKLEERGLTEKRLTFDKSEDKFIEDSREINFPWHLIAETLGREVGEVKARSRKLKLTNPRRYDQPDTGLPERDCLVHRGKFQPSHPGNFVCDDCKSTELWKSGEWMG